MPRPTFFDEVFANAEYFVFFTNPLGSDGRGNEFADITGKHGESTSDVHGTSQMRY